MIEHDVRTAKERLSFRKNGHEMYVILAVAIMGALVFIGNFIFGI